MAGGKSGRGAYWLGALLGLAVSAALAVALSALTPLNGGQRVASDERAPIGASRSQPSPQAQPQPVAEQANATAPQPQVATAPASPSAPAPEPSPGAAPEPAAEIVAVAPQPPQPPRPADVEETAEPAPAPAPAAINALPPFKANSEIYNGDRSQPLLSIVLISDPTDRALLDELLLLPGPLSVIVPPEADDAQGMILDVRDAGFEALLGLDAARAGDAGARIAATDAVIGVALLGEGAAGAGVAEGVVPLLRDGGLALLDATADGGAAPFRSARSNGVPAAPKGRVFDEVQSSAMVFQALERAAFDARRTGAFIVIGKAHPAVLTGLRRWMNVKANKSVNVAPLSVVIDKVSRQ